MVSTVSTIVGVSKWRGNQNNSDEKQHPEKNTIQVRNTLVGQTIHGNTADKLFEKLLMLLVSHGSLNKTKFTTSTSPLHKLIILMISCVSKVDGCADVLFLLQMFTVYVVKGISTRSCLFIFAYSTSCMCTLLHSRPYVVVPSARFRKSSDWLALNLSGNRHLEIAQTTLAWFCR